MNQNPVMSEPVDTQAAMDVGSEMECAKDVTLDGCMLDDILISGGKSRPKLTRSQKRYQRSHHTQILKTGALDISSEELKKLQNKDPSLETLRVGEGKSETHFYDSEGLLFRRWIPMDVMQSQQWTSLCYPHSVEKLCCNWHMRYQLLDIWASTRLPRGSYTGLLAYPLQGCGRLLQELPSAPEMVKTEGGEGSTHPITCGDGTVPTCGNGHCWSTAQNQVR